VSYPHRWRAERIPPGGTQDPDTGKWTAPYARVLYDGPADCQDEGEVIGRDMDGRPVRSGDAVLYLANEAAAPLHIPGDTGVVTWEDGTTANAEVVRVVRLDGKLLLRWLQ
jgi:hypothetical protein